MVFMRKIKRFFLLSIIFFIVIIIILNFNYTLKFEEIQSIIPEEELNPIHCTMKPWFSVRDKKFNGWYDLSYIENLGIDCKDWDFQKYTYIICRGYELKKFSISPIKLNKKSTLSLEFVGITEFNETFSNQIYVYRINKCNVDFNYDEPAMYSIFGERNYREILVNDYGVTIG